MALVNLGAEIHLEGVWAEELVMVINKLREVEKRIGEYEYMRLDIDNLIWKYEMNSAVVVMQGGEESLQQILNDLRTRKEAIDLEIAVLEDQKEKLEKRLLELLKLNEEEIHILYDDNSAGLYPAVVIPLDFEDRFWIDVSPTVTFTVKYSVRGG